MNFDFSQKTQDLIFRLNNFMDAQVYPNESVYYQQINTQGDRWEIPPIIEELKEKGKSKKPGIVESVSTGQC